ncbi:MAG: hypothetical protein FWD26_11350 [Treponema sp.]|nr:hypothetical protein [Treponema sp.]
MKLRFFILFSLFLTITCFLSAQSPAEEFENLLNTQTVTYAQASRFILEAAEVPAALDDAFQYAVEHGWLPRYAGSNDEARLKHIALLLAGAFDIKGGLLYSLTKNSRYAYRELKYINVIQGRVASSMPVSGERLVFYVNRMLARQEN